MSVEKAKKLLRNTKQMLEGGSPVGYSHQKVYDWICEAIIDLESEPETTEFTKKCRKAYSFAFRIPEGKILNRDVRWLKEACDIIDRQITRIKELEQKEK